MKHWEHVEDVTQIDFKKFKDHKTPLTTKAKIPANTAVYVECEGKKLEGIYDSELKAIRALNADKKIPNRDLRLYADALNNRNITILAIDGLMGTGKTSSIVEWVINQHLKDVKIPKNQGEWDTWKPPSGIHKILIAKPHVPAGGEQYGFLPGDLDNKLDPTLGNFIQYFDRNHNAGFNDLRDAGYVQILPLAFVRGLDADNMTIIADETQNTRELISIATRRAKDSRIILLGDTSPFQIDLKGNSSKKNGLTELIQLLSGASYFQYIEMKSIEHIVRSDEVKDIVKRLFNKYGSDPQEWIM